MDEALKIEISSPVFRSVSHDAEQVVLPGKAGIFTVLPGHTPLLTTLVPGVVIINAADGKQHFYAVNGGFAEVAGGTVLVLADEVAPSAKIDRAAAQADLEHASEGMKRPGLFPDQASAEHALVRARAWVQAADREEY